MPAGHPPNALKTLIEANDEDSEASADFKVLLRTCVEASSHVDARHECALLEYVNWGANRHVEYVRDGLDPDEVERRQIEAVEFQTNFWKGRNEDNVQRAGASFQSSSTEPFTSKANGLSQSEQEKRQEETSQAGSSQADTAQAVFTQAFTQATSSHATSPQVASSRSTSKTPQEKQLTGSSRVASSQSAATMPSRVAGRDSSQSEVERLQRLTIEVQTELLRERKVTTELQAELLKERKDNESLRKECERLREEEKGAPPPPSRRTRPDRRTELLTTTHFSSSSAFEPLRSTGNDLSQQAAPKPSKRPATGPLTPAPSKKRAKTATNRDATDQIMAMIKVKPAGSASLVALADHSDDLSQTVRAKIGPFGRKPYIVDGKWIEGCFVAKAYQVSPIYDRDTKKEKDGIHACADCVSRRVPCIFMDPKGDGTEAVMLPLPEEERPEGATPDEVRYYCKE